MFFYSYYRPYAFICTKQTIIELSVFHSKIRNRYNVCSIIIPSPGGKSHLNNQIISRITDYTDYTYNLQKIFQNK